MYNNIYINKDESIIKKETDGGYGIAIPESITKKLFNSIVNIKLNNGKNATGFFMKINIKKKEMKCLFTCEHVISQNDINNKITINIYYGENNKDSS